MLSDRFGQFYIEGPYSAAMENCLQHRGFENGRRCGGQYTLEPGPSRFTVDGVEPR